VLHVCSFYSSVAAAERKTLVSKRIGFPYIIKSIRIKYALGHNSLVQHEFFVSEDDEAPTAVIPSGTNILAQYGNVSYVCGDDDVEILDDNTIVDTMGTWLKVHAYNTDTYVHTINVRITIDDLRPHPVMAHLLELLQGLTGEKV